MNKTYNKDLNQQKIYLVGGAVRDKLLNVPSYDKDYVAVGFTNQDFSHLKQVGKDFPVFIQEDGSELALARVEKKISQGYNGFSVETKDISIEDDLKRRDLTINSIAFNEETSTYIDPFDGIKDLEKKVLKHTSKSFIEDPVRVLRVARFRAKYGYDWKIHHSTKVLIYKMRDELKYLQKDRVYKEIDKVLELESSDMFFNTLFELGVLDVVFPSIYKLTTLKEGSIYHMEATVFEHTMMVLKKLKNRSKLLKLTAIYHDIAKPHCYREYGNSAKHDNKLLVEELIDIQIPVKLKKKMLIIIENHIKIYILNEMKDSKKATFFESFKKNRELFEDLITFADADNQGRICLENKENLPKEKLLLIFDTISNYSPKSWIDSCADLSNDSIKQHIHKYNIGVVKKYF
ncbi:MAG: polynucleotide adenylyltransferase [Campylobacterota bacterium]|nr:polynucleotide adenylyltransferase [Campylobacterota bacterium]